MAKAIVKKQIVMQLTEEEAQILHDFIQNEKFGSGVNREVIDKIEDELYGVLD